MKRALVSFEGPIGVGKSTLWTLLQSHLEKAFGKDKFAMCQEPVEQWIENDILRLSYEEPKLYSFPAQCVFFTSRIKHLRDQMVENKDVNLFISERSPFSDKMFWELKLKLEDVTPVLHKAYMDMWNLWQDLMPPDVRQPSLFIYLKASVDTCMARLKERNRDAEKTVGPDYQRALIEEHDNIFCSDYVYMPDGKTIPCITVDAEVNYKDDPKELDKIATQIIDKIKEVLG